MKMNDVKKYIKELLEEKYEHKKAVIIDKDLIDLIVVKDD